MSDKTWRKPNSRSVGLFTDLRLFSEALEIVSERGIINRQILEDELPQRLQGLMFVESQSKRAANDLIRELRSFHWIWPVNGLKRPSATDCIQMGNEPLICQKQINGHFCAN